MDGFFKKRTNESENSKNAKRQKLSSEEIKNLRGDPKVVVAWNCNGITSRLHAAQSDALQFREFVKTQEPDVIFLSEVRLPAANNCGSGKAGPLAKWYRSRIRDNDRKSADDSKLFHSYFRNPEFANYEIYLSLANTKYSGTAMLLNTRTTKPPKSIRYNLDKMSVKGNVHDNEGRVIVAKFETFSILHTYSPNNGWSTESHNRRKEWDEKVRLFMVRKKEADVQIMWVGDLNVAPLDVDLSHPAYYRKQTSGRNGKASSQTDLAPENIGQPGCSDAERERFFKILEDGELIDAYRELRGNEDSSGLSWRGIISGKHGGKGMRIDHCILSRKLMKRIEDFKITGYGEMRNGFLGSDHSPIVVYIKDSNSSAVLANTDDGLTKPTQTTAEKKQAQVENKNEKSIEEIEGS